MTDLKLHCTEDSNDYVEVKPIDGGGWEVSVHDGITMVVDTVNITTEEGRQIGALVFGDDEYIVVDVGPLNLEGREGVFVEVAQGDSTTVYLSVDDTRRFFDYFKAEPWWT